MHSQFVQFIKEENERIEAIQHLPHVGELLYSGSPDHAIEHLEATHKMLSGKKEKDHILSYKADGRVSIVFGKRAGQPFVKYKGPGAPTLQSELLIHQYIDDSGKEHLRQPLIRGFQAASHPRMEDGVAYQADVMLPTHPGSPTVEGNIIKYKKPRPSVSHTIAVHTQIDSTSGKIVASQPDASHLDSPETHFPNLNLSDNSFDMLPNESKSITDHIGEAKKIMSDSSVLNIADEIARHRDPTNKTGHRHLHFIKFANQVQRGARERTIDSMIDWTQELISLRTGKEQERLKGHLDYIQRNKQHITKLLQAHYHIDMARGGIVDVINKSKDLPLIPEGGHSEGEGFVSEMPGLGQVKLVPSSFTIRNNQNRERFQRNG